LWKSEVPVNLPAQSRSSDPGTPSQGGAVVAIIPIIAILLIVALIAAFMWMNERDIRVEQREKLVRDTLWVEQTLRFQLESHESNLYRLAAEMGQSAELPANTLARARHMEANHAELVYIALRRIDGTLDAIAPVGDPGLQEDMAMLPTVGVPPRTQGQPSRAQWSPPVFVRGRLLSVLRLPVFSEHNVPLGTLEAVLSLGNLLRANVPWWIGERYQVSLTSVGGDTLVSKSNAQADSSAAYTMAFDPPFSGLFLTLSPFEASEDGRLQQTLLSVILGLTLLAVVNLWMQRRHLKLRIRAEQALRREQVFRKAMEDSITVGLRARDLEGRIIYVNPAFARMVGWEPGEIIGRSPPMPWWQPDLISETLERHRNLGQVPTAHSFETVFRRRDGKALDVMVYEAPLIDAGGTHVGWMASIIDVSDRRRAEEQASQQADRLQQTGRLITMGEMASTLAHELNQPLAAIASYAAGCLNMLQREPVDHARLHTTLENLAGQNRRAGQIIRRIHDFVRKREPEREDCDLVRLVEDTVAFAALDARRSGVRLAFEATQTHLAVSVDPVLIEQVLLNLIRNATEAMQDVAGPDKLVRVSVERHEERALVAVADMGHGIAPEVMERVFMPFVTTKAVGMGMGLNICRSILEIHQGHLWFEAGASGGATFLFSLPCAPGVEEG